MGLGLFYLLVTRPGSRRPADNAAELRRDSPETAAGDHVHRVLVIANGGLARPELTARVERIAAERPTEIRIVAPAAPASRLREFGADEVLLVPGDERGWPEAARLGAGLEQDGLRVTRLGAPESAG